MVRYPPKRHNLLAAICHCLKRGEFVDTAHSSGRADERLITRPEVLYVLEHGWHESRKDFYDSRYQCWNSAIRGKTIDLRELRVIVSFDDSGLLIITVIDLDV